MTGIERCIARIRHIQDLNNPPPLGTNVEEGVAVTPEAHFHIRKSQNFPENIPMFLRKHSGDPAIKVCRLLFSGYVAYTPMTGFSPETQAIPSS